MARMKGTSPVLLGCLLSLVIAGCEGTLGVRSLGEDEAGAEGPGSGTGAKGGDADGEPEHFEEPILPGYSVIRRLNGYEYQNTVRDLLSTELPVTAAFPADDLGGEFANIGSALSLSPLYVLAYERAAHELADELFTRADQVSARIVTCDVETAESPACAEQIVGPFAERAFRRPLAEGELMSLLLPYRRAEELGASRTEGLKYSLAAVLFSPHFLFRVEEQVADGEASRRLVGHEMATRLSYTLWATMPDEILFQKAKSGELSTNEGIEAEIARMLSDERSDGFLDNFVAHWLNYFRLETHEVEATAFPEYDANIALSMKEEARLFAREFLNAPRPLKEMLDADFTFLDDSLAEHYGMDRPNTGEPFERVENEGSTRGGLLTLGAVLLTTSFSTRTSAVVRGKYVFDRLLCGEIPPPPPGVEGLPLDATGLTQRERLDLHRSEPICNGCHEVMDQLGFGMENYDAVGQYRTMEGSSPIDATGVLPDGTSFDGALELGKILAEDPRFLSCVTKKFMTYALGRELEEEDEWLGYLSQQVSAGEGTFLGVIREVLMSEAFRARERASEPP